MSDNSSKPSFDASNIEVLTACMAIRRRPRMYVSEVSVQGLSNAISKTTLYSLDPDMMNQATKTLITVNSDNSYSFQDDGRGVPIIRTHRLYTDCILEILVAGPGVNKELYEQMGFLVNWGAILNALSETFLVETTLDGVYSFIAFSRGQVTSPYSESAQTNKRGTKIIFKPDKEIWEDVELEPQMLLDSLQEAFKEFPQALIRLEQPQDANERFRIRVTLN